MVPSNGYSDEELAAAMIDLESDLVERKRTLTAGATDYRNRLIAEIMRNLGFVQHFGVGIPRALGALAANGNPEPEFYSDHSRVLVTVGAAR